MVNSKSRCLTSHFSGGLTWIIQGINDMSFTTKKVNALDNIGTISSGDLLVGERVNGTTVLIEYQAAGGGGDEITDGDFTTNGLMTRTAAGVYTSRTISGTASRITISDGDGQAGNPTVDLSTSYVGQTSITTLGTIAIGTWNGSTIGAAYIADSYLLNTGDVGTGVYDFGGADSLEIPNGATTNVTVNGQIAVDTTVTDFSAGLLKYFSTEEMATVAMPIAQFTTPTDGHVVSYNATSDEFELAGVNIVDDTTPQLGGDLDLNGQFIGIGVSSTSTKFSLVNGGSGLRTYGNDANHYMEYNNSGYYVQWGTTFNRMEMDTTNDLRVYTNNVQRAQINDSGLKLGTGASVTTVLDEDAMGSDSATALATQQSIKAYVDSSSDWELISSGSASASSSIDFTGLSSSYITYVVVFYDIIPATDTDAFWMRTSTDGGTSYDAGASDYGWAASVNYVTGGGPGVTNEGDIADAQIVLNGSSGTGTGEAISGVVTIFNPAGTAYTYMNYDFTVLNALGTLARYPGGAMRNSSADVDAIRFLMSTGNITSGEFRLYGIKGV